MTKRRIVGYIFEGRSLTAKDTNGLTDAYIKYGTTNSKGNYHSIEKKKNPFKSKTVKKTLNPVWRQQFDIMIDSTCKHFKVEVWDGINNRFMGQTLIDLSQLHVGKEVEDWQPLTRRPSKLKETVTGEIRIKIVLLDDNDTSFKKLTDEEEMTLDDIRTGDIDLILGALSSSPNSQAVQESALSSLFKWAATASVHDRVSILEKYPDLFNTIIASISSFPNEKLIQFYGLGTFTSFTKLMESKPHFTEKIAKLLVSSMRNPPKDLSEKDKMFFIANCIISLANVCTCKFETHYTEDIENCQRLVVNAGAIEETLSQLKLHQHHEILRKIALAFLLKSSNSNEKVCEKFLDLKIHEEMVTILSNANDAMTKWLCVDVLHHFVRNNNKKFAKTLLKIENIINKILEQAKKEEGIHSASLHTSIVYLIHALLQNLSSNDFEKLSDENSIEILLRAYTLYKKYIPKDHQKLKLPERLLDILATLSKNDIKVRKRIIKKEYVDIYCSIIEEYINEESVISRMKDLLSIIKDDETLIDILKDNESLYNILNSHKETLNINFDDLICNKKD